jgi:hypothetical protein
VQKRPSKQFTKAFLNYDTTTAPNHAAKLAPSQHTTLPIPSNTSTPRNQNNLVRLLAGNQLEPRTESTRSRTDLSLNLTDHELNTMPASRYIQRELVYTPGRTAVVIGGTGATGSKVLDILLARGEWEKVVVVGRREVPQQHEKLVQVVTELDLASLEKTKEHWVGATNVFNCIGTTRKQAKSAANFVAIEVGITEATAKIAKEAGVLHYSVVSAQGASTKVPAISWFQPMLYTNTLGRKQQAVIEKNVSDGRLNCCALYTDLAHCYHHAPCFTNGMHIRVDIFWACS